jgi:hypothetical protein
MIKFDICIVLEASNLGALYFTCLVGKKVRIFLFVAYTVNPVCCVFPFYQEKGSSLAIVKGWLQSILHQIDMWQ